MASLVAGILLHPTKLVLRYCSGVHAELGMSTYYDGPKSQRPTPLLGF